jgi:hypothetical protein
MRRESRRLDWAESINPPASGPGVGLAGRRSDRDRQEREVTAMMRLDTDPMMPAPRTGRAATEIMPLLIQVPRVAEPTARGRLRRPESAGHGASARWIASRPGGSASPRREARPRRRLRLGVRRAGWSLMALAAMAGTFAMGWTTGAGSPRLPLLRTAAPALDPGGTSPFVVDVGRWSDTPTPAAETRGDASATAPTLGAPVADAEVPVVFPGYLLPDNNREESAHEGS